MDNAKATTGDYIMADSVTINGTTYDSVGVKYKGNSSYNANQTKNPWHIEMDTYKDHDYQGYKDIKLANVAKDPSFLRDVLGYQIVRKYMDAPLANYANLYVNGTLIGLYSNTESITKTFVKDRFGSKTNSFFNCSPPDGASPQSGDYPNLVYLGQDSADYYDAYEMKSDIGWKELINFTDTLKNYTSNIEDILDVDRALWMLAFDNAIVNLDSYIGQFSQNYYLYRDDFGRFLPVVWDLNESFGTFSGTGSGTLNNTTAKQQMTHLLHSTDANFPLVSKLLAVPTYKKMYLAHLKTIMTENFTNNGPYYTVAQTLKSTIDAAVQADPNKFYTYAQFNSNITTDVTSGGGPGGGSTPGITNLMNARYTYLLSQSDFAAIQPVITNVLVSTVTPALGNTITITANVTNGSNVYLRYRTQAYAPFDKIEMFDDGNHNDGAANDNVYGADITLNTITTDYYIYSENSTIGAFSPARAQHEFHTIFITGSITPGDIVINEFLASNDTTKADQDGDYDDWVELYNNSTTAIDISGYKLSDDLTDLTVFSFPKGTILQPGAYIVVWADGDVNEAGYHADFKLSASGETVYLTDSSKVVVDSVAFGVQSTDISFGRYTNGTGAFRFLQPTFGAENTVQSTASVKEIEVVSDLSIYPNPTTGILNITYSQTSNVAEVYVYSTEGRHISSHTISGGKASVDVAVLSSGMYYLILKDGEHVKAQKFIKQ